MKDILQKLYGNEGILGAFIHDGKTMLEHSLSQEIAPETADLMGRLIGRAEMGDEAAGISPRKITFYFDGLVLIAAHISGNLSLNIVGTRTANLPVLEVSLNAALAELAKRYASEARLTVEDVIMGPFAFLFERIQEAFSEYVGPVAIILLREGVEKWLTQGPPEAKRLSELATILSGEVAQSDKAQFIARVKAIINKMV